MCVHGMRNMKTENSNFQSADVKLNPFRLKWTRKKYIGPHIRINAGSQLHREKFQRFIDGKSVIQNSKFQIQEFHTHVPCRPGPEAWLSRAGSQYLARNLVVSRREQAPEMWERWLSPVRRRIAAQSGMLVMNVSLV